MMDTARISIELIESNTGQIAGLPSNPRQWTKKEIKQIAKSLVETPELFDARPIIVTPHDGKFIILGGNLRFEGCKANKATDAPCVIIPEGTPADKLKEIVIKDNGTFGAWDYDQLANEWDVPLVEWGVPAWDAEDENTEPSETAPVESFGVSIKFPSDEERTRFVAMYKDELEQTFHCSVNES